MTKVGNVLKGHPYSTLHHQEINFQFVDRGVERSAYGTGFIVEGKF
jgi:hypothetical protein